MKVLAVAAEATQIHGVATLCINNKPRLVNKNMNKRNTNNVRLSTKTRSRLAKKAVVL